MDSRKRTALLGRAAPIVYVLTVILGGALSPGYSHLRDPISLLASTGAPYAGLMNTLFALYNILLFFFGASWWFEQEGASRSGRRAANLLALMGILGVTMFFFPQDAAGSRVTPSGGMHIILAAAMSLTTILAMLFRGLAEWREPGQRKLAVYSLVSVFVVFVTGGLAAVSIAGYLQYGGLYERCTIGAFLLWVFIEATLLRAPPRARQI